ncbi:MAG: endonuclease/exonuclease/phosphatase family protein [Saprospiraceae bacterium]|nr:endonuclease/exonuclease/phosphatase family protein [Saprospiraceae bacterium]
MKNWKSTWVWAILAVLTSFHAKSQSLKIMSYNIRLDVASDGENAWPQRRDFLAGQIKFYEPDIFGTQEGLPHQIEFLQKCFPDYNSAGIGREGGGKGESTHIFFQKSKFLLRKSHTFWLSPTPDSVSMGWDAACLRVCTAVLLKNKKTKQQFWVFNTHLDHVGETARRNSIALILKKIEVLNKTKLPVIFMGDLNAEPDSVIITQLDKEMKNTRTVSETPPFGPSGTFNRFKFEEPVTRLIDYIFVSKSSGVSVKKFAVLSDSKNLRYPSDHFPVFVELELRK